MKKIIAIILALTFILSFCTIVNAEENIKVIIDIKTVKFDVPPTIVNGRTLVPLRAIFEALGATVDWDDATQTVTSEKGETKISLTINSNIMTVNGEEKTLDVPATLIDSRTLVPVRAISESFGLQVGWDGENNLVSILSNTDAFTMLYAKGSRSKVFAKSSAATQAKHGWYEYPVTAVYSADGKESVVATDEAQSYIDSGYYAYPVKTVYAADGSETVIRAEEFNAYIANGYLAEKPVAAVPGENKPEDGKTDYSEYSNLSEEELAKLTLKIFIKNNLPSSIENKQITKMLSLYGGYYNDTFFIITDLNATNSGYHKYTAVVRLEENSTVTCGYDEWTDGKKGQSGFRYDWAKELIPQKTTLFKAYNSNQIRDEIDEYTSTTSFK